MKVVYNSPFILTLAFACTTIFVLSGILGENTMSFLFAVPGNTVSFQFANPLAYFRLVSHSVGHASWEHLMGNMTLILLIGPMLEEKYGSKRLAWMCFITALITGILNQTLFTHGLLGASGLAFMMILLTSFANFKGDGIPLTFLVICALYLFKEVANSFTPNNVSQFAHILGGAMGSIFGFQKTK